MAGIPLEACDCKLQIGYVDDVRFTWYTFEGMDSWMSLALAVGAILSYGYFDNYGYMLLPLDQVFFCAWHFS